jgi:hypothetical protein
MSETIVQNVDQNAMVDLFGDFASTNTGGAKPSFGMSEVGNETNLFNTGPTNPPPDSTTVQTTEPPAAGAPAPPASGEPAKEPEKQPGEADILGDNKGQAQPQGSVLSDLSSYYQDRIKNGKFIAVMDVDKDGKEIPFVPKTAEEYDEVLELQIQHRMQTAKKDMEKSWYNSKSPAWKAVSRYAELVDDPTQLIPFLQGVRTLTSVANLDENDLEGAEAIVRTRLAQNGDPEDVIKQQIDSLKTTNTLVSTAKAYKPIILHQEQAYLQNEFRQKEDQDRQYYQMVQELRDSALKSIEAPVFGKTKLKQDEKAAIYDLIAEPAEDTQGYGIFNALDDLFEKRDFERLKEVALLISNRDAFMNYLGTSVANATAASLERKLRLAGESRSASGNDFHEENTGQPRVTRNQFKKPSFGR